METYDVVEPTSSIADFKQHFVYNFSKLHIKKRRDYQLSIMIFTTVALSILFAAGSVTAQNQTRDGCPKDEYACIDIINSSQCISQLVIQQLSPVTKEALVKCIEYEGTVTTMPGASKVRSNEHDDVDRQKIC